jgi:hypothetical protein
MIAQLELRERGREPVDEPEASALPGEEDDVGIDEVPLVEEGVVGQLIDLLVAEGQVEAINWFEEDPRTERDAAAQDRREDLRLAGIRG